ncbi:MAG TPA: sensor histidine kinase [Saprospiraceae bacterium]|nr:sensor histidine kinase [Saprospiraceae bacterium]
MKKKVTPLKVCVMLAISNTLITLLVIAVLSLAGKTQINTWQIFLIALLVFGASYTVTYLIIKKYILQKLIQIYKAIQHKGKSKNMLMSKNVFEQTSQDVSKWAKELDEEVQTQTQLANYRRLFIGNFSHEIRTPIFNIQGYIDTLIDGAMDDDNVREKYLNQASKNVTRLISIVEDLTTISKLEYNQVVMNITEFDLIPVIYDIFDELALKAEEFEIELKLDSHGHNFFTVKGDKMAIRQVLSNLLLNSIKYGKTKGKTTVNLLDMNTYAIIQVTDNGIGIEEKHLGHLCDRFYRVSTSRSRTAGGTGLGLAIVKHILEAHNQSLSISSNYGKGSTFAFQLEK